VFLFCLVLYSSSGCTEDCELVFELPKSGGVLGSRKGTLQRENCDEFTKKKTGKYFTKNITKNLMVEILMGKGMFQTNSKHINSRRRIKIVNIC
jgi:hypothetical protein